MKRKFLPTFVIDLRDRTNQERSLQAIRTRFLLILGVWTFVVCTYLLWGMSYYLNAIHIVCGVTLLANAVAYSLMRRWELPLTITIISTFADMLAITFLVYFTGGLNSLFFALYLIQILGVSLLLNLSFSAIMVVWAVALVATMKALESAGIIPNSALFIPTTANDTTDIIIWLVFQAIMFCLVAFLGGNLSNKLKSNQRELAQKRDIEKAYEALRQANESKSRLLANVSHNLRTPLTSIIGFSELLVSEEQPEEERQEFARIIHGESRYLARLVSDTFYLSELQGEPAAWNMMETDISKITAEVVNDQKQSASERGVTLVVDCPKTPLIVYGDPASLKDVVARITDNAVKFTEGGKVIIKATEDGEYACVSVADTGIGIPADIHGTIFEPLEQIYKTDHKTVPQRTGLGLAICRAVIEHHHGRIWFESEPNEGSTFYFTLPLSKP